MNLESYPLITSEDMLEFEFISNGPKGSIKKIIRYQRVKSYRIPLYNLFFGDWIEYENRLSDVEKSNNGDTEKILATIAASVVQFIQTTTKAVIIAKGSTPSRTRLYQIGLNRHWDEISRLFGIEGYVNGRWQPYEPGKNYEAFLLYKHLEP